jgi:hypothetical protein
MSTTPVTPEVAPDPFKGETPTLEEYNHWRDKGELPERFKEAPVAEEAKTEEGKEPPKAEQAETGTERDEHGKFKAKDKEPLFTPEQQTAFDKAFRKREAKIRREYEDRIAAIESAKQQGTAPAKEPEETAAEPKRPEPPKLADYSGTVEEYEKELSEYPAKLQAYFDAQRSSQERGRAIQEKLNASEKAAIKSHPDYTSKFDEIKAEVAAGDRVGLPDHVLKAIAEEADDPYEVTYHLIEHPEEWDKFTSLSAKEAVKAVIRLDANLAIAKISASNKEAPAPKKKTPVTAAPEPPNPVGARATATEFDVNDPTIPVEEWLEKRNQQLSKKRG